MRADACLVRHAERRPGARPRHVATHRLALLCATFTLLSAGLACSANTAPFTGSTESAAPVQVAPTSGQESQDQIVSKICQRQNVAVSLNKCGEFYSVYPTGFVVDAATEIYGSNGEHVDSCGGNRYFTSDEA